ncbi:MAG: VCBS repeat-containing protein [Limisphaerales bacterium]
MLKGDGSFFLYTGASLDEPFSVGRTVISADIDNDGYRDLLVSASNPWVEMYHNNGDFSFTRLQIGWTGGTQNASSFGDFKRGW